MDDGIVVRSDRNQHKDSTNFLDGVIGDGGRRRNASMNEEVSTSSHPEVNCNGMHRTVIPSTISAPDELLFVPVICKCARDANEDVHNRYYLLLHH